MAVLATSMESGIKLEGAQPPKASQTEAQKKAAQAEKKIAMDILKRQEAEGLKVVYMLLASANDNYAGHKAKAMHEVEAALTLLDKNAKKPLQQRVQALQNLNKLVAAKLYAAALAADAVEMQALSDAQVANAGGMLLYFSTFMAQNNQKNILAHVQKAIKEIDAAPKHDVADATMRGREANVLTSAYILLASANHDYDGHRVKAMKKIEQASNHLEMDILKKDAVQQKIKALQDANAEAVAKIKNNQNPTISEPQVISDAQLLLADAVIQRVAFYLSDGKQHKTVLNHIRDADAEIGIALSIR
jgi:hypothetical protein